MYTVELPTNLEDANGMLDCWDDQPVGDAVKKARDLAQSNEAVIRTGLDYIALSCWLVAWSYEHGMSLEEQVQMADDYAHLFAVKGKHYTFSRTNLGPRIPAAGIEP